jgi:hypothetical protein
VPPALSVARLLNVSEEGMAHNPCVWG